MFAAIFRSVVASISIFTIQTLAWAGPVNSSNGYPAAAMNEGGDYLLAGDRKIVAVWRGTFGSERRSTAPFRFPESTSLPFEAGVAGASDDVRLARGIVCAGSNVALFYPERTPGAPGGRWELKKEIGGSSWGRSAVSCAMTPSGRYAIFVASEKLFVSDNGSQIKLQVPIGNSWKLLASGERFLLVGTKGKVFWMLPSGTSYSASAVSEFGVSTTANYPAFAASENYLMKAADDGLYLSKITNSPSSGSPQLETPVRVPAAPCADNQRCGLSLAPDGTWFVAGYWGMFLGKGQVALRQKMASMSLETGGMALAHQGATGRFALIGNDDGEVGFLNEPSLSDIEGQHSVPSFVGERWVVWSKSARAALAPDETLFPWSPNESKGGDFYANHNSPMVKIHRGALPRPIPSDWVAWEPEVSFAPLPFERSHFGSLSGEIDAKSWWWVKALEVEATHRLAAERGIKPAEVVVSIVDSGADITHPWLVSGLYRNSREIPDNALDDDDNGYVDDVFGFDFVEEDSIPQDEFGHGTHVAGLIGAHNPNTNVAVALNESIKIRPLRALDRYGKSNSIDLARAVRYAVDEHSDFLNCSWGGGPVTQILRDAFAYAVASHVFVVSSAGNDRLNTDSNPQVPKLFPGVVSVAALTAGGRLADFSSWGEKSVAWMAPGDKIQSTLPGGLIGEKSGTSMASPIAVNSAAWIFGLLRARSPDLSAAALVETTQSLLCSTADPKGVEGKSSCGRISPRKATERIFAR